MKKLILLLIAAGLFACRGPEGPQGPGTNRFVQDFTVQTQHWVGASSPAENIPHYFYYDAPFSQLTSTVYRLGTVQVFLYQNIVINNANTQVLTPLSYTVFKEINGTQFAEHYTFDYRTGFVTFIMRDSDFELGNPPTQTFRVVFEW